METTKPIPLSLPATARVARKVWAVMIASIPLVVGFVESHNPPKPRIISPTFIWYIRALAIMCALCWLFLRSSYMRKTWRLLREDPNQTGSIKRFQVGYITCFVLSEAIVLYGINLRFYGARLDGALPFYVGGLLLMLFSMPRNPLPAN
jgi:hypothetical protein